MVLGLGLGLNYVGSGGGSPAPSPPVNTVAPALSGDFFVGQTLACSTGTWTGSPTITYTYQWQNAGVNIGGATNSTYTLVSGDDGDSIRCVVTATNAAGSASANSNAVIAIAAAVWVDASDISTITQSGGAVSQWNDKSGNARNYTQGSGSLQPITGTYSVNGLNAIRFENKWMNSTNFSTSQPLSFFLVAKSVNLTLGDQHLFSGIYTVNEPIIYITNSPYNVQMYAGTALNNGTNNANTNAFVGTFNGASSSFTRNGVTTTGTTGGSNGYAQGVKLGARQSNTGFSSQDYCEYALFPRVLTSDERTQLTQYAVSKWGVVV